MNQNIGLILMQKGYKKYKNWKSYKIVCTNFFAISHYAILHFKTTNN